MSSRLLDHWNVSGLMPRFVWRRAKPSAIALANRARDAGKWEIASGHYRTVLLRNPNNPPIWVQYGHVLKESGHLGEAERAYRRAIAYDRRVADSHLQLGHVLKLEGKKEEARVAYLQAFALDPSLDDASCELAGFGWSEAHISELRGMLRADESSPPIPASQYRALDGEPLAAAPLTPHGAPDG
jgi:tetratricopeptide (TPR) repeat protein